MSLNNPLEITVRRLFERLNLLNGMLSLLNNQLKNFRELFSQYLQVGSYKITDIFAGFSLVITDLTGPTDNGWLHKYPSGNFYTKGEAYLTISDEIIKREANWSVAQGFEAFETFLYDIGATYLTVNSEAIELDKWLKFTRDKGEKDITQYSDVRAYLKFVCRNNKEVLKFLRKISVDIEIVELQNNRGENLQIWYKVMEIVRHAVTHSNMIISEKDIRSLSSDERIILDLSFQGVLLEDGRYSLGITLLQAKRALETLSEYAFGIFKSISITQSYDWRILPNQRSE